MSEKKNILIIDDEEDIRIILKAFLENEGYNVYEAKNGFEGIEIAKEKDIDLILLDIMMPQMDGFETLKKLRDDEKTAYIPVIMLTGLNEKSKVKNAINQGVTYYITKPFDNIELASKIRLALKENTF